MKRRAVLTTSATFGTSLLAGCLGGGSGGDQAENMMTTTEGDMMTSTAGDGMTADTTIQMVNTAFDPLKAEVATGATVEWVNEDSFSHDVTSAQFSEGATAWDFMATVSLGESVTYTFEESGVYEYYCSIHGKSTMCGAVLVGDVSYGGGLPCGNGGGY